MLRDSLRANEREMWLIVNNFYYGDDFLNQDRDFIRRERFVYGGGEVEIFQHPRTATSKLPSGV